MNESEWLACDDPVLMLPFLTTTLPSGRKLRLFAAACAMLLPNRTLGLRKSIDAAVAFADGKIGAPEMEAARWDQPPGPWTVCSPDAGEAAYHVIRDDSLTGRRAEMAALLRDIFGNPFRPVPFRVPGPHGRRWFRGWASAIYRDQNFAALPILADALEEAGCLEEPLLRHLRGETECPRPDDGDGPCGVCGGPGWVPGGPHVTGCWALDLILGKE